MQEKEIHCCQCEKKVDAMLVDGRRIYAHRSDLTDIPFWECRTCGNHVGCHHKTDNPTQPLGCIPSPEIRALRSEIHRMVDPIWKSGRYKRHEIYKEIGKHMGFRYHTAQLRTVDECNAVIQFIHDRYRKVS